MLRRFAPSSAFARRSLSSLSVAASLESSAFFCATTSPPPPEKPPLDPLLARAVAIDSATSSWSLTQADIVESVQLLHDIGAGKIQVPENDEDAVPYQVMSNAGAAPDAAASKQTIVIPFVLSSLYRAILNYPGWHTITSTTAADEHHHQTVQLRRPGTPDRDVLAAPVSVFNTTAAAASKGDEKDKLAIFELASSAALCEPIIASSAKSSDSTLTTIPIAGYELFQIAMMRTASAERKFGGLSLDRGTPRHTLIANTDQSRAMAQTIMCDASLETSLVLAKWLVEESAETRIEGHRALFVGQAIKTLLERGSYYVLQNGNKGAYVFTSMHHLMRWRNFAVMNAKEEWDALGPWQIGTAEASQLKWDSTTLTVNPTPPNDADAAKFPAFGIKFSKQGIDQMQRIAAGMP